MADNIKILLVDDEEDILKSFLRTLKREGYHIDTAQNGKEAWEKYQQNYYDVIISDWKMPEMDGLQLIEKIDQYVPRPHVIMITAFADEKSAIEAHHHHAFDYLTKPVSNETLLAAVKKAAELKDGVIAALENWIATHPEQADAPEMGTFTDEQTWSARQALEEIRRNTDKGREIYQDIMQLTIDLLTRGVAKRDK